MKYYPNLSTELKQQTNTTPPILRSLPLQSWMEPLNFHINPVNRLQQGIEFLNNYGHTAVTEVE